ncbi:MAG: hypothetical protein SNH57_07465 [Rikenellaceae bacterium]
MNVKKFLLNGGLATLLLAFTSLSVASCGDSSTEDDGSNNNSSQNDDDDDDDDDDSTSGPTYPGVSDDQETPDRGDESWVATIDATDYYGRKLSKVFYDLKMSAGGIGSATKAETIFVNANMNGVRISIFGNDDNPAHPSAGVVDGSYYEKTLASIAYAKAARGSNEFIVFASKKLTGSTSFPDWTIDSSGYVQAEPYSVMLFDYIKYMDSQGVTIDVLGIDNEIEWNKANITPSVHYNVVTKLKVLLEEAGLPIPQFIGPERYVLNASAIAWSEEFFNNATYNPTIDIYGMHYYPEQRKWYSNLLHDLELKGDREFWATEPHWNAMGKEAVAGDFYGYCEYTIGAIWDQTDNGCDNLIWWSYDGSDTRAALIQAITLPIFGAQPVMVVDHDGFSMRDGDSDTTVNGRGWLHTRAFRNGSTLILYVLNTCAETDVATLGKEYTNYEFTLEDGAKFTGIKATQQQWYDGVEDEVNGETSYIDVYNSKSIFLNIPKRSFTMIKLAISNS